jgi:hypothetical protein
MAKCACFRGEGEQQQREGGASKGRRVPYNKNNAHNHPGLTYSYRMDVATSLHCRTTSVLRAQPLPQAKLRHMRYNLTAHISRWQETRYKIGGLLW